MKYIVKTVWQIATLLWIIPGEICADDGLSNPSVRPQEQPRTIDIFVDALYWYTTENVDWAYVVHSKGISSQIDYKAFVFDWAPGFRIRLGHNMEHDRWDTQASYTWFHSSASDTSAGLITPGFFSVRLSDLEPFSEGKANINIHYNMFDLDLGRAFFISNHFALRPSIGMKAGWISQSINSQWSRVIDTIPILAAENLQQSFAGGGAKGGVSTRWCFGNIQQHFFSLIGTFEAGYLWGQWSIQDKYEDTLDTIIYTNTTPRSFGSFMLHYFTGLGWDVNFDHNQAHFAFKLGYEIEDWFNHCQFFTDINGAQSNDLILQGASASLGFEF